MTWDEEKYALLKPALWQYNGKFVGLDHVVPLGANGISVSQVNGSVTLPPQPTATPTKTNPGVSPTKTPPAPTPTPSNNGSMSFPYNATYKYGQSSFAADQNAINQTVLTEWQSWKSAHITSSGAGGFKRVQRDAATNFDTVSEGMGYGLLLAVYFGDQTLFNDLFRYVKKYYNGNGLMSWHIDANGNITSHDGGYDAATDADEDIAVSLVFAHKKWGSTGAINYETEAKNLINNLYNKGVEAGSYVFKPGDNWGGSSVTNPSYFSPAWYRIFADFTGNNNWNNVANKCYEIVNNIKKYNNNTGLVPDWCKADGTAVAGKGYDYYYDAVRFPLRTAIDYSWFGTPEAKGVCDANAEFFKKIGVTNIKDGYKINGQLIGQWHSATFVACTAAGAMTGADRSFGSSMLQETIKTKDSGQYTYFGNTLRMMSLLYTTGNLPNLYNYNPVVPSPTPTITPPPATPTPTNTPQTFVCGDANKDGVFNSIDFAFVRMFLLGMQLPREMDAKAADVDGSGQVNAIDFAYMRQRLLGMIDKFPAER
jgi:endo-1,4-beta-D-glucanase Y